MPGEAVKWQFIVPGCVLGLLLIVVAGFVASCKKPPPPIEPPCTPSVSFVSVCDLKVTCGHPKHRMTVEERPPGVIVTCWCDGN